MLPNKSSRALVGFNIIGWSKNRSRKFKIYIFMIEQLAQCFWNIVQPDVIIHISDVHSTVDVQPLFWSLH